MCGREGNSNIFFAVMIFLHIYMCIYMYIYIYVYVYIYTYTYVDKTYPEVSEKGVPPNHPFIFFDFP